MCTLADGSVVFQDTACTVEPKPAAKPVSIANTIPLGIEESWFDSPGIKPNETVCTQRGCDCGKYFREFKNGLPMAIADALYLDGSWHRLEAKLSQLEITALGSAEYELLKAERDEAACNISMSQKTLRMFGEKTLAKLRGQKRHAEDMGWDNPEDCDAGIARVCEHTDNIALYNRIRSDIRALSIAARTSDDSLDAPLAIESVRRTQNEAEVVTKDGEPRVSAAKAAD